MEMRVALDSLFSVIISIKIGYGLILFESDARPLNIVVEYIRCEKDGAGLKVIHNIN